MFWLLPLLFLFFGQSTNLCPFIGCLQTLQQGAFLCMSGCGATIGTMVKKKSILFLKILHQPKYFSQQWKENGWGMVVLKYATG